jgi:general secretion pathway protein D
MMVGAQTTTPRTGGQFTPDFRNQDISIVAEAVGAATGITFLPDPRVRANVSLTLPAGSRPLTAQQFYAMFLSMLGQNGFVAMPAGNNTMKIVPEGNARSMPGNDLPTSTNLVPDEIVTDVLETKNVNGLQVSTVLRSFISPAGQIIPVPGTNTMIITDRAGNVARLRRLLARVDQSSNSDIQMIPLENAIASEVARLLTSLLTAQPADAGGGGVVPRVQADDRTNSIVVSGDRGRHYGNRRRRRGPFGGGERRPQREDHRPRGHQQAHHHRAITADGRPHVHHRAARPAA